MWFYDPHSYWISRLTISLNSRLSLKSLPHPYKVLFLMKYENKDDANIFYTSVQMMIGSN